MGLLSKMSRWQNISKTNQVIYDMQHEKITVAPGGILAPANKEEEEYYKKILKVNVFFAPAGPGQSAPGAGVSVTRSAKVSASGGGEVKNGETEKAETEKSTKQSPDNAKVDISDQPKDGLKSLDSTPKEQIIIPPKQSQFIPSTAKIEIETGRRKRRPAVKREDETENKSDNKPEVIPPSDNAGYDKEEKSEVEPEGNHE